MPWSCQAALLKIIGVFANSLDNWGDGYIAGFGWQRAARSTARKARPPYGRPSPATHLPLRALPSRRILPSSLSVLMRRVTVEVDTPRS